MNTHELFILIFQVLGGLSLFIYGMHVMTGSLRTAAGSSLRNILARATRSRYHGFAFGTITGFLAHTGAAITMLAGFINAGVMTLTQSIAPIFGANLGTSLSMQLISFNISEYCWAAIGIGFLLKSFIPSERYRHIGGAFIGFGLLFLGMETISGGIAPHKDLLAPYIAHVDGSTWGGRLAGVGLAALLTALLTSSGAMIGLCFALINADALTGFDQVAPIILGAHIGTCIVPLMASLSMRISARRAAIAHVVFNMANVAFALAIWPILETICSLGKDIPLVARAANLHTFAMLAAGVLLLPFVHAFTRFVTRVSPSKESEPEPSYLDGALLCTPERAIQAAIRELHRIANICVECMMISGQLIVSPNRKLYRRLAVNEEIIDEVQLFMYDYLHSLTQRSLSDRQSTFVQHLHRCMKDLERIGDHIGHIAEVSIDRYHNKDALLPEDLFTTWFSLFCSAKDVIVLLARAFDPDTLSFQNTALEILRARDRYQIQSMDAKADFAEATKTERITPIAGYYISRCIENLDRLVRRAKSIAFIASQPTFTIKSSKLDLDVAIRGKYKDFPKLVNPKPYIELLRRQTALFEEDEAIPFEDEPQRMQPIPTQAPFNPPPPPAAP